MSSGVDRADQFIHIKRQIIDVLTGAAPAMDEQGRDRYFLLITDLARIGEEAEREAKQADGGRGATGAEDRTA